MTPYDDSQILFFYIYLYPTGNCVNWWNNKLHKYHVVWGWQNWQPRNHPFYDLVVFLSPGQSAGCVWSHIGENVRNEEQSREEEGPIEKHLAFHSSHCTSSALAAPQREDDESSAFMLIVRRVKSSEGSVQLSMLILNIYHVQENCNCVVNFKKYTRLLPPFW